MEFITYRSSSPAGDCISFLAGIKKMWEDTGKKGIFYQRLGMQGVGYPDSIHPFLNGEDEPICMNKYMFDMLSPLICSQEYIEDFRVYDGGKVDFDFDKIRLERFTNQPFGGLNRWYTYVFPQMASDLSLPWIKIHGDYKSDKVLLNFTQRYRNPVINYYFLREHEKHLVFAGLKKERDLFCEQWGLDIPLLEVKDFFELGKHINGCRMFLGNASMCYQIAEALKVPRILETFQRMPNVIPMGKDGYDFYAQSSLEYRFTKLLNS